MGTNYHKRCIPNAPFGMWHVHNEIHFLFFLGKQELFLLLFPLKNADQIAGCVVIGFIVVESHGLCAKLSYLHGKALK